MTLFEKLVSATNGEWDKYANHIFGKKLVDESLTEKGFHEYLIQDYIYLQHYSRAYCLLGFKSNTKEELEFSINGARDILEGEVLMHQDFNNMNLSIEGKEEHINCIAYTRYLSHVGNKGDFLDLLVALAPCTIGYGELGKNISKLECSSSNKFKRWIDEYSSEEYFLSCQEYINFLNSYEKYITENRLNELKKIFNDVVRLEIEFFNIALEE